MAILFALVLASVLPQSQATQTIRGRVVDSVSDMPLPGANILLLGTDPTVGANADLDGRFEISGVPLGRHDIQVSFLGYRSRTIEQLLVASGKEPFLDVRLEEQAIVGEELVIVPDERRDRSLNDLSLVSARSFSVEETRRYAGGLDDPARIASAFAGITTSGGVQENALVIRGNAPKGVLWRLEGVEIPNPNHFAGLSVSGGGGLTLFSSRLLADSDFLTGAFPAEYGNALAGVFDMNFRSGNPARREHAIQAGLLGIEGTTEGPFRSGRGATYLVNYRYSTLGLLLPLLPTEDLATYQDLSFKLSFPTRRAGRFDVWGIGGLDTQSGKASRDSSEWEFETWDRLESELDLAVGAAGISHRVVLGRTGFLHTSLAGTYNRTRWEQDRIGDDLALRDDLSIRSGLGRLILGSYINSRLSDRVTNRSGFSVQRLSYDLSIQAVATGQSVPLEVVDGRGATHLLQVYSQAKWKVGASVDLVVGGHLQRLALTGDTSVEPRVGIRWDLRGGQALTAGYGRHSRMEEVPVYFVTDSDGHNPNDRLRMSKADHIVLGYERSPTELHHVRAEVYFQNLFDVPVIADSSFSMLNFQQDFGFNAPLVNQGAGHNYGLEITAERFLNGGYYHHIAGSVFSSRYRGGDGVWRHTRFDRTYSFNALVGKETTVFGDDLLGANLRITHTGGERRSPVDVVRSESLQEVVFDETRAFSEQEAGQTTLDLTLTLRRNRARIGEVWALQIKNFLGATDTIYDYSFRSNRVEEVQEGFPLPVLSYRVEF